MEEFRKFGEHEWEQSALLRPHLIITTVHKHILLPTMTVKIGIEHDGPLIMHFFYQSFGSINSWVKVFVRYFPSSVQITTS